MSVPSRSKRISVVEALLLLIVLVRGVAEAVWSYEHPETWEDRCQGVTQSPLNFTDVSPFSPPPFVFENYGLVNISLENNGHALNVKLDPPPIHRPRVSGGGLKGKYVLDAFHFHWGKRHDLGSEHLLMGCAFSGEMHFVHYKEEYGTVKEALNHPDGLAVLGVWLRESWSDPESISEVLAARADKHLAGAVGWRGEEAYRYSVEEHAAAAYYWLTNLSPSSATVQDAHVHVHLRQLLPFDDSIFYRYEGSLTTPPCTENVMWTVFQESIVLPRPLLQGLRKLTTPVPPEEIEHNLADHDTIHSLSNNFRPTQSLGNRTLYFSGNEAERATTCSIPQRSRTTCLDFPDVVISEAAVEEEVCHRTPLDLHLRDAEVVVSPALSWKRLGTCRTVSVVNDGRIVRVRYSTRAPQWQLTGSNLTVTYYLGEIVLRLGSKHLLGGLSFPLEAQLIHYNSMYSNLQEALSQPDGVVVVVKFFQEPVSSWDGSWSKHLYNGHNKILHNIFEALEGEEEGEDVRAKSPDVRHLLDSTSSFYEYYGPVPGAQCNTSITWVILRKPSTVSREQLAHMEEMLGPHTAPADQPVVPSPLLLRVNSPHLATEYKSILELAKSKPHVAASSIHKSEAAPQSLLSEENSGCTLNSHPLLLTMPLLAMAGRRG
ncbi:uncharacterized protein LOC123517513 [Portunus trituberculatus]|uniref:uncharacterized protein LOC123517513 n=1 Tax=Portunus trituberculatus TaxID=210409 RepID=UPI001E1CDCAE|nr:uncharacterized protein LOC123517513 [Portunus trituberculatus]